MEIQSHSALLPKSYAPNRMDSLVGWWAAGAMLLLFIVARPNPSVRSLPFVGLNNKYLHTFQPNSIESTHNSTMATQTVYLYPLARP